MPFPRTLLRGVYHATIAAGRPFGGVRPRRVYDMLGRLAYPRAELAPFTNRWGHELLLSHAYHIDRNILIFGEYDADLHALIESRVEPGMICMDVGANLGEMALHMAARAGALGRVWAFEPVPTVFHRLEEHVRRNGLDAVVRPQRIALSDRTGEATIACADIAGDNQGLASIVNLSDKAGPLRTAVPTERLDDFAVRHGMSRLDFVKIDIQGAEVLLLEGGRETLARLGPDIVMEVSPDDLRHLGRSSRDLCEMIESLGYAIHAIERGRPGRRLRSAEVAADFEATNVLCTRRSA